MEPVRLAHMIPGRYDVAARVKDMDLDGVAAQLSLPSLPGFAGGTFFDAEDKDLALLCVRAWNDFMLDEWSAAPPGRSFPW